jgi:hypothetical protein
LEEEVESLTAMKRLWLSDNDNNSSDSPKEEMDEEVSFEETLMNQLDNSEEKLFASALVACSSATTVTPLCRRQSTHPQKPPALR